jgi:hypothetical protein
MAASLPGVTLVPGQEGDPSGFSVLGLSPDQNNTTLNGLNFGGSNLPRDANVSTSLVTTPYDVARGDGDERVADCVERFFISRCEKFILGPVCGSAVQPV